LSWNDPPFGSLLHHAELRTTPLQAADTARSASFK
jgi:hypothetical protein